MSILSVGVDYFQTLSVIMKLFVPLPPGVELPFDISIVIGWMQWFQLDLDMTGPECALRGFLTYERKWWVKVSFPLLGGILVAVFVIIIYVKRTLTKCQIWLADRKRRRPRKKKQISNEAPLSAVVISMTFAMIYFLYLTICRTALEIFNCADTEPKTGRYYMVSEPMEECFVIGALQDRLAPYALMVLAGYTGGYPMLLLCIFHYYKDKIIADQVMRAHDRGETPRTNRFFFLRIAFGKVYYMFRPKHYRWGLTVLARKFLLSVIFLLFNDDVTFQVASILGVVFVNFVLQVRFMPYMGTREKAVVIREEAEERILTEIKRLERAQLLVKINGKSYYELMHKMRVEIDEQEEIMNKHKHDLFNLNTVETTLLGALVFLCLCAVMTNSKYLMERDYSVHSMVIVIVALTLIFFTSLYFITCVLFELRTAAKRRKTRREMLWARIKSNSSKIRGMAAKGLLTKKRGLLQKFPGKVSSTGPAPEAILEKGISMTRPPNAPTISSKATEGKTQSFLLPKVQIIPVQNTQGVIDPYGDLHKDASSTFQSSDHNPEKMSSLSSTAVSSSSNMLSSSAESAYSSGSGSDIDALETLARANVENNRNDDDLSVINSGTTASQVISDEEDIIEEAQNVDLGNESQNASSSEDDAPSLFNR